MRQIVPENANILCDKIPWTPNHGTTVKVYLVSDRNSRGNFRYFFKLTHIELHLSLPFVFKLNLNGGWYSQGHFRIRGMIDYVDMTIILLFDIKS